MVSVMSGSRYITSASRYITSASRYIMTASSYHPRYQSRSSMYIRKLAEVAEAVSIGLCMGYFVFWPSPIDFLGYKDLFLC